MYQSRSFWDGGFFDSAESSIMRMNVWRPLLRSALIVGFISTLIFLKPSDCGFSVVFGISALRSIRRIISERKKAFSAPVEIAPRGATQKNLRQKIYARIGSTPGMGCCLGRTRSSPVHFDGMVNGEMKDWKWEGKSVLITGANSGLGKICTRVVYKSHLLAAKSSCSVDA